VYDNREPRALRQLPLDWRRLQPRHRAPAKMHLLLIVAVLAVLGYAIVAFPLPH
jgi:hypothetical protein